METTGGVIIILCGLVLTIIFTIIYTVYIIIYIRKIYSRRIERIYTEKDIIPCPKSYIQAPTSPIRYNGIDIKIDFIKKNGGEVFYYKENDFIYLVVCFKNDHLDDLDIGDLVVINKRTNYYVREITSITQKNIDKEDSLFGLSGIGRDKFKEVVDSKDIEYKVLCKING